MAKGNTDRESGQIDVKKTSSIFDELNRLHDAIKERAYDLFQTNGDLSAGPLEDWLRAERELVWRPAIELREKDGQVELEAALAGVDPKNLDVQVTPEDILIIANEQHRHESQEGTVHVCEFKSGRVFRSVHLPEPINPDTAKAEFRNGLLHVRAAVAAPALEAKKIPVAVG